MLYLSRVYSNLTPVLDEAAAAASPNKNGVARCDVTTDGRFPIFGQPFNRIQRIKSLSIAEPIKMQVNGLVFWLTVACPIVLKKAAGVGKVGHSTNFHKGDAQKFFLNNRPILVVNLTYAPLDNY